MIHAVIDTNVLVSALLTSKSDAATVQVLDAVMNGHIIPLYNEEIISEYEIVLNRPTFSFPEDMVCYYINAIKEKGILATRILSDEHFPNTPTVVTPAQLLDIL